MGGSCERLALLTADTQLPLVLGAAIAILWEIERLHRAWKLSFVNLRVENNLRVRAVGLCCALACCLHLVVSFARRIAAVVTRVLRLFLQHVLNAIGRPAAGPPRCGDAAAGTAWRAAGRSRVPAQLVE
eukprot:1767105-Prymnesium_polylepis.1